MAEDISSLLLKALGGNKSAGREDSSLPDSLKKLTEAITKSMQERANTSKKELSASEKRNQAIDGLFRQYQADLKETARIFKALNETEANSLKLAEKEAKEGAAYRKRVEAANRRAEKLNSVNERQAGERQKNWLGLIGAIGGKGFQGVVENFVKASEQTKKDIATISDARYEDITAKAAEAREDKVAAADKGLETAKQARGQAIQNATEMEGRALQKMMAGDKTLDTTEKADAALKAARANQRSVAEEGTAKIKAVKEGNEEAPARGERAERGAAAPVAASRGERVERGGAAPLAAPLGDIASAIREGAEKNSGLILDASTKDAIQKEKVSKVEAEVAEKNLAADVEVSKAGDEYAAAVAKDTQGLVEYAEGTGDAGAARKAKETANAQLAYIESATVDKKAGALREEEQTVKEAFTQKQEGSLVSDQAKKSIGSANTMNMAIAPPALVIIGKVMEKFKEMFPVIEQTGGALIEMATAIPAVGITLGNELAAKLIFMGSQISDAIRFTDNDLRERYEKSNKEVIDATGKSRAEWFTAYQDARVVEEKERAKNVKVASSDGGILSAAKLSGPVRMNEPAAYSVEKIPGTASGITHEAPTREAAQAQARVREEERQRNLPVRPPEQSVGVVPVGASNRNIDEWR